jgi:hypothetical protein
MIALLEKHSCSTLAPQVPLSNRYLAQVSAPGAAGGAQRTRKAQGLAYLAPPSAMKVRGGSLCASSFASQYFVFAMLQAHALSTHPCSLVH